MRDMQAMMPEFDRDAFLGAIRTLVSTDKKSTEGVHDDDNEGAVSEGGGGEEHHSSEYDAVRRRL